MKLADFDFRVWDNREQCYLNENYLENSPFQAMGLVKAHKSSFFGHNFDKVALFSAGEDKECGFGWNSGDDDNSHELEIWTGMKDKNGKRIYENDILQDSKGDKYIVSICDESRDWILLKLDLSPCCSLIEILQEGYVKVIGNIHENAELLKETK